ncbi:alpha-L-fucosidase [Planctomycetes bacterium CA13]|uniref:alpha-L-fucosidase n=1 Tax=Novipirellula herctigrandis TaxID=2527986 RepID=UPI0011B368EC
MDRGQWGKAARSAGMTAVLATKHHDGFCLWNTKVTDYRIASSFMSEIESKRIRMPSEKAF